MKPALVFLVGPTAVGKTDLSLRLAKKISAEIISCDSMQVYRGMDILTSKPSPQARARIRHHLLDCVSPSRDFNVSAYRKKAIACIKAIIKRKHTPLFVGGSGLYMSVVVDGIFEAKTEDPAVRAELYRQAQEHGSASLHRRLAEVDPAAAAKIHPHDTRRIVRALEVFTVTGKPISGLQASRRGLSDDYAISIFCLDLSRQQLYERIEERVEKMFRQGVVKEVQRLLRRPLGRTASRAIGIREIQGYLQGHHSLAEAKELMKKNTRQYARRQLTWFRKDKRITWIKDGKSLISHYQMPHGKK